MPNQFHTHRRIEFADTDMAGIVHFARFMVFMEAAEHEFLRSLGLSVHLEHQGNIYSWPRLACQCDYTKPVRFEQELDIRVAIKRLGNKSITYEFHFAKDNEPVAYGTLTAACCICNPGAPMRAVPIPEFIREKLN